LEGREWGKPQARYFMSERKLTMPRR
jgi:hypothetical protein